MQYRTDLAMERIDDAEPLEGVHVENEEVLGFTRHLVEIKSEAAAQALQKPTGCYITFHTAYPRQLDQAARLDLAQAIADSLSPMLPDDGDILVVGLGNRRITSDALGSRVTEGVLVTRHLKNVLPDSLRHRLRGVCSLAPGVLGVTGMETAEMVRAAALHVHPSAIIAIDALAARECARIGTTIQLSNTGIQPGSGVGNHRTGLTQETLHVPVIAIGVPLVVYTGVIIRDALSALLDDIPKDTQHDKAAEQLAQKITDEAFAEMVVTPREIDELVGGLAQIIALAVNIALQPRLNRQEITMLTNEIL